jgi:hypothetical protein
MGDARPHPQPVSRAPRLLARLLRRDVRVGIPPGEDPWGWNCGFYPGCHPREQTHGTAATFDQARGEFEQAWRIFLSNRTETDFQAWRHQRDQTARKYAVWERGELLPSQKPNSMMCCPCGETFDSHRLADNLIHVPHITAAQATDGIRR